MAKRIGKIIGCSLALVGLVVLFLDAIKFYSLYYDGPAAFSFESSSAGVLVSMLRDVAVMSFGLLLISMFMIPEQKEEEYLSSVRDHLNELE